MTIREIIEAKENKTKEEGKKNKNQLRAILKIANYCPKENGKSWKHNPRKNENYRGSRKVLKPEAGCLASGLSACIISVK